MPSTSSTLPMKSDGVQIDDKRPGQVLWLLGLTRLQTQVDYHNVSVCRLEENHKFPFLHNIFLSLNSLEFL